MKRATILLIVLAVALAGAGVPTAPADERAGGETHIVAVRTHAVQGTEDATDYWTRERMRNARPAPIPDVSPAAGLRQVTRLPTGGSKLVPPTTPRSGSGAIEEGSSRTEKGPYPYSRIEIINTQDFPNSTHGKVFFTDRSDGIDYVCSGTIVSTVNPDDPEGDPGNGSVVWTAGRCVYLERWHMNWMFAPAYRDGQTPLGKWSAVHLSAPAAWIYGKGKNVRQDLGVAVVDTDELGRSISSVAGGRGIAFRATRESFYQAFGYPAADNDGAIPEFTGGREFVCQSPHSSNDDPPGKGPPTMAIGCDMTAGSSGGGWIIQNRYVASVNSYRYDEPEVMYGPYQGDEALALYESVRGLVLHPMIIGIRLKKHLVVTGRLTSIDGFDACEVGAIVRVSPEEGISVEGTQIHAHRSAGHVQDEDQGPAREVPGVCARGTGG